MDDFNDGDQFNEFGAFNTVYTWTPAEATRAFEDPGYGNNAAKIGFSNLDAGNSVEFSLETVSREDVSAYDRISFDCICDIADQVSVVLSLESLNMVTFESGGIATTASVLGNPGEWISHTLNFASDFDDQHEFFGFYFEPGNLLAIRYIIESNSGIVAGTLWVDNVVLLEGAAVDKAAKGWDSLKSLFRKK